MEKNTKQIILEAAESEFLEKGYDGARTTQIAKKAGVTHAMVHYYFGTKRNIFNEVFFDKIYTLAKSFLNVFTQKKNFFDTVKNIVEMHFEFLAKHPNLLSFLYSEVVNDEKNRAILVDTLLPTIKENVLDNVNTLLETEIKKGTIHEIKAIDFVMNIVSINIVTLLAIPILKNLDGFNTDERIEKYLNERKKSNAEFIVNALKK